MAVNVGGKFSDSELLLKDAVDRVGAAAGALILLETCRLKTVAVRGWPRAKDPSVYLGAANQRELFSRLKNGFPPRRGGPFIMSLAIGGRRPLGYLVLAGKKRPFTPAERRRAATAAQIASRLLISERALEKLQKNYLNTILMLLQTLESKDPFVKGHSQRVADYCRRVGAAAGLGNRAVDSLFWAGLLHDIGKVGIVDTILTKPSPLGPEEMAIVQEHPIIGQRIVQDVDSLRASAVIIRHHHERYDGRGYPDGLSGKNIPPPAGILALAEAFDTITVDTPYRRGRGFEAAALEMRREKGTQFDPTLTDLFLETVILG